MTNEPTQFSPNNPASLFAPPDAVFTGPDLTIVYDSVSRAVIELNIDERVDTIRSKTPLAGVGKLVRHDKSQVYQVDEAAKAMYLEKREFYLNPPKNTKRKSPEPASRNILPVDVATLEAFPTKHKSIDVPKPAVMPRESELPEPELELPEPEPELPEPELELPELELPEPERELFIIDEKAASPPKRQKLPDSEEGEEEKKEKRVTFEDPSENSSDESGIVEPAPPADEDSDGDSSSDSSSMSSSKPDVKADDLSFVTQKQNQTDVASSEGSSSVEDSEASRVEDSASSESSEDESIDSDDDIPLTKRVRKEVKRYNDEDFSDEEHEKKKKKKPGANAASAVRVEKVRNPTTTMLGQPASTRRDKPTDAVPPPVATLSNLETFHSRGKHLTKFYQDGWETLMDYSIHVACNFEFMAAGRRTNPGDPKHPKPRSLPQPKILVLLMERFRAHLFERPETALLQAGSEEAVLLEIQRIFYVYRECSMNNVENDWTKITLWKPYEWAQERGYAASYTLHVKTEHINAYANLRAALYPQEYTVYRVRLAITTTIHDPKETRGWDELYDVVRKQATLKKNLCNDWSVACQLADLDIFKIWSEFDAYFMN